MKQLRVYLSSTFEDLKEYRAAVFGALEKAGLAVARMEGYTAADERPLDLCLRDVAQSDIYVGLFAWRYGYVPPPEHGNPLGKSITELEYRHAGERSLWKLVFFAHADTKTTWPGRFKDEVTGEGERGQRLERLRKELGTEKTAIFFRTPDDLATQVLASIMRSRLSGRAFTVPSPPPKFVARPQLTELLIESLVGAGSPNGNTVVHGEGGFGKTTLALDACHRSEVINAFPNGIFWTSLGDRPDLGKTLADLYVSVTGVPPLETAPESIVEALRKVLGGGAYLVVLDDPWRAEDVMPFLRLRGARFLVCTRVRNLVEQAGEVAWAEISVDEMRSDEAGALLTRGFALSEALPRGVRSLAHQLGRWPLLLELANARLLEEHKRGRGDLVSCVDWLAKLFESRGVRVLDRRDSKARNAAAASSVAASLDFAEIAHLGVSRKAAEIAIFPEDTAIPLSALTALWTMDPLDVEEDVLRPLDNLSVVKWDRRNGEVRLHDVFRLVLAGRLVNPRDVHGTLIDAWGDLRCLPDHYSWRWIAYHMRCAERIDQFRTLLLDYGWIAAKLRALGIAALTADYELLPEDRDIRLVQRALQLSAHALTQDSDQLLPQLHGRLLDQESSGIVELLASARRSHKHPWLRPRSASLARAAGALLRTLRGHESIILDAAVTPDGQRVISAAADNTLIVWKLATGTTEHVLRGHTRSASKVVVTPDSRRAISASLDRTVRVWDLEHGNELLVFRGHNSTTEALAVTSDSQRAISASEDGTIKVWDLMTGAEQYVLAGHSDGVTDLKLTQDGRFLVSASKDSTVAVWDLEDGTERHTFGIRNWRAGQTITMSDGRVGIYFPADGFLELCDFTAGTTLQSFVGHAGVVDSIAVTADGRRIVSASRDRTLRVWDLQSGTELHVLRGHLDQAAVVVTTPDGRHAISGSLDRTVRLWDLETGEPVATLAGHAFDVFFVAVIHDGRRVLSASSDNTIKVWDLESATELGTLRAHTEQVRALVLTPDGRHAISGSNDATLRVWDLELVADSQAWNGHIGSVKAVAVSADSRRAVTGGAAQTPLAMRDNTLKVWDLDTATELKTLDGHRDAVLNIAVTRDGERAVSAGADGSLKVWDLNVGIELATLKDDSEAVRILAITPNGRLAVSASAGQLIVWDLHCATRLRTLSAHQDLIQAIVISADGGVAVSASRDETLKAWDIESGTELRTLRGHTDSVDAVAMTPDGRRVVSASADGAVRVWDLATGDALISVAGMGAAAALSADGGWAVCPSSSTRMLTIWNLSTGELVRTFPTDLKYFERVAILSGLRAVSISPSDTVRLWSLTSGAVIANYTGESNLTSFAVTASGTIVVGEQTGRVHLLHIEE